MELPLVIFHGFTFVTKRIEYFLSPGPRGPKGGCVAFFASLIG